MKKSISRTLIICGSVAAALVVVILVLCLYSAKPITESLGGYDRAELYDFNDTSLSDRLEVTAGDGNFAALENGLKSTKYSMMQGLLEGKAGSSYGFKSGGELDLAGFNALAPAENRYLVRFIYNAPRTVKVNGQTITYDRALLMVENSFNEIRNLEAVFYLDDELAAENAQDYFTAPTVLIKADSTVLYNAIGSILSSRGSSRR